MGSVDQSQQSCYSILWLFTLVRYK
uniref:Uncharacterized protein n=1 Tax=Anguilla anguilla TaxID=7936 RepID=A0A0E9V608_ANGAN